MLKEDKQQEDRIHSYNSKGELFLTKEEYQNALNSFNTAIEKCEWFDPKSHYNLGYTYLLIAEKTDASGSPEAFNRLSLALQEFRSIISHIESHPAYRQYSNLTSDKQNLLVLCYLNCGGISRSLYQYDQAILYFKKVIDFSSERHAYALFELGVTYYKYVLLANKSPKKVLIPEIQANLSIYEKLELALTEFTNALMFIKEKDASESDIKLKAHILSYQGHIYLRKHKLVQALSYYDLAIKTDKDSLTYIAAEKDYIFQVLQDDKSPTGTFQLKESQRQGTILHTIIMHPRGDTPCKPNHGTAKKINDELKRRGRNDSNTNNADNNINNTKKIRRTLSFGLKDKGKNVEMESDISNENQDTKNLAQKTNKRSFLHFTSKPDLHKSTALTSFNDQSNDTETTINLPQIK